MSEEKISGQGPIDLTTDLDKRRIEKQLEAKDRRENDIRGFMNTAGNRRIVQEILDFCGAFRNAYVPDSDQTVYNTGLRAAGLKIMEIIGSVCPDKILQMQEEARAQKIQHDKEIHKPVQ